MPLFEKGIILLKYPGFFRVNKHNKENDTSFAQHHHVNALYHYKFVEVSSPMTLTNIGHGMTSVGCNIVDLLVLNVQQPTFHFNFNGEHGTM